MSRVSWRITGYVGGGGVVGGFASGPPCAVWVAVFGGACSVDQFGWAVVGAEVNELWPGDEVEEGVSSSHDRARRAVDAVFARPAA